MSLLFLYISNWSKPTPGKAFYKLILACNRNERHSRPSPQVQSWPQPNTHILAGIIPRHDDHGAWLGVSKYGKLGCILRIKRGITETFCEEYFRQQRLRHQMISRLSIVPQYLRDGTPSSSESKLSSWEFSNKLCTGLEHRSTVTRMLPFHLLTFDLMGDPSSGNVIKATYLSNACTPDINIKCRPVDITPEPSSGEFYAFGNSPKYKPFQKVIQGKQEFIDIISQYTASEDGEIVVNEQNKISLRNDLLSFLRSSKCHLPDPVLQEYARQSRIKEKIVYRLSSRFVTDYFDNATKTQNIILVDTDNNVTFFDWFMHDPVHDPQVEWEQYEHRFKIE